MARVYADPEVARFVGGAGLNSESIPLQVADFADEWDLRGYGQSAVIDRESGAFLAGVAVPAIVHPVERTSRSKVLIGLSAPR
jgi:hypothetical protein